MLPSIKMYQFIEVGILQFSQISVPEVYKESSDFRTLLKWFALALTRVKFDTENFLDLYDPLRCPDKLVWMLADTMGFKYDSRLPIAFNRLVLIYFMSMIRYRGSIDGIALAAETNLAQFNINQVANTGYKTRHGEFVPPKEILNNRLEDTSIPVNSVYVTPHTPEGYIEVVYFASKIPIDACIEYVRPLGMYLFPSAGVRLDARTKVSVDARLTDLNNLGMSLGPTHVGNYRRRDYARSQTNIDQNLPRRGNMTGYKVQKKYIWKLDGGGKKVSIDNIKYDIVGPDGKVVQTCVSEYEALKLIPQYNRIKPADLNKSQFYRSEVYYRNSDYEEEPGKYGINPGFRSLYSLQLANNDQVMQALFPDMEPIFSLGYGPQDVSTRYPDNYLRPSGHSIYEDRPANATAHPATQAWNLRYDKAQEAKNLGDYDTYTIDDNRSPNILKPRPAVNPIMKSLGDAVALNPDGSETAGTNTNDYYMIDEDGKLKRKPSSDLK